MTVNSRTAEYGISDLSKEFEVTTRSIRHYEDIGLLTPQRRGKTRIYTPADRTKLKLILRGKRLGFSLEESREIVEMYDPDQGNTTQLNSLLERIQIQREKLKQQLNDIHTMRHDLKEAEAACRKSLNKIRS
ncbi:MAG TPA: MerR family DNA-binding transcriptional regulator [Porticoccus sp.]|nr:MerR family DNA-binding transcriptional regulator [Porticoccus sp.]